MLTIIILAAAFIGVATLVGGVALLLRGETGTAVEERLDVLAGNKAAVPGKGGDAESSVLASPLDDTKNIVEELLSRIGNLQRFLEQADAPLTPSKFLVVVGVFAFLAGAGSIIGGIPVFFAPACAVCGALLPLFWIVFRRKKRLKRFARQLPEALELISRALRAGHSLASGISLVATEMPEPISKEFGRCYEEQNLGVPMDEALEDMTQRVPNLDLRFFATAVILQRQTGGDLAEILDKIGTLIRERFQIWGQIQALTGEGRLSGIVLLALPPVLFITMYKLNPEYVMILFDDPMGHKMLAIAVIMQIVGALVIRKIVNIKV